MTKPSKQLAFNVDEQVAKGNYQAMPAKAVFQSDVPARLKVLYAETWHGMSGTCTASNETLAAEVGCSTESVKRANRANEGLGVINPRKGRKGQTNEITFPPMAQNVALPAPTDPNVLMLTVPDYYLERMDMDGWAEVAIDMMRHHFSQYDSLDEMEESNRRAREQVDAFKLTEEGKVWTASGGFTVENENVEAWEAFIAACPEHDIPDAWGLDWRICPPLHHLTRGADDVWMHSSGAPMEMVDQVVEAFGDDAWEWTEEMIRKAAAGLRGEHVVTPLEVEG